MADALESRDFMLHYYLVLYGILYYDYFSTLYKEYWTIWKAKWSAVKVLFLVNRYLMLVESIIILVGFQLNWTTERCQSLYIPWQTILPVIIAAAGSVILLLRTHIIWGQPRWILYVLVPLLIAHLTTSTFLAATHVGALQFPGGIGPCMVAAKNAVMDIYCILPMIFDLTTSGLCVYRSFKLQREAGNFASSLLRNFTRHGTLYAVGAAVANASNLAFMAITSKQLGLPTVPSNGGMLCTVFSSIFISRLAMSLKDEDESRRRASEGMIPLTSMRSSGTGSDFKGPRDSTLSGATFVNMPTLDKTRRKSEVSTAQVNENESTSSSLPHFLIPVAGASAHSSQNGPAEDPNEYPQWLNRDKRPTSVVWMTRPPRKSSVRQLCPVPAPSKVLADLERQVPLPTTSDVQESSRPTRGHNSRATKGTDGTFYTVDLGSTPAPSDRADNGSEALSERNDSPTDERARPREVTSFPQDGDDISPNMWVGGELVPREKGVKESLAKSTLWRPERALQVIHEDSLMDRASKVVPFVCSSSSSRSDHQGEASPTEATWLGTAIHDSPTDLEDIAHSETAPPTPAGLPYAHPPNSPATPATAFETAPTSAFETACSSAGSVYSQITDGSGNRHILPRVPIPSPTSPARLSSSKRPSRRASWVNNGQLKFQDVQA